MTSRNTGRLIAAAGVAALGVAAGLALSKTKRTARKAAMALTGDWERQLKAEHRSVRKLLKAMVDSGIDQAAERATLLTSLDDILTRHALEEEKVIYPALQSAGAGEAVAVLFAGHAEMKTLVRGLQELAAEDPLWLDGAKALRKLVLGHVKAEEELFPLLHELGDKDRNRTLTTLVRREAVRVG
jgi:hemerythrin superfamily protein